MNGAKFHLDALSALRYFLYNIPRILSRHGRQRQQIDHYADFLSVFQLPETILKFCQAVMNIKLVRETNSPHRNDLTYPVLLSLTKLSLLNACTEFIPRDGLVWMLGLHLIREDRLVGLPIVRVLVHRARRCYWKLYLRLIEALPGRLGDIELWSVIPVKLGHLK